MLILFSYFTVFCLLFRRAGFVIPHFFTIRIFNPILIYISLHYFDFVYITYYIIGLPLALARILIAIKRWNTYRFTACKASNPPRRMYCISLSRVKDRKLFWNRLQCLLEKLKIMGITYLF